MRARSRGERPPKARRLGGRMADGLITIFGGSGFIGRHLVKRLAATGRQLRIALRDPEAALHLRPMGAVGQIDLVAANVRDDASVARAVRGATDVVNLVGILAEKGRQTFQAVHVEAPERIARAARAAGAARLLHVSAVGADPKAPSLYGRSKAAGEQRLRAAFPRATIVRQSIVFGLEDDFLNRFGTMARFLPVLPVFGGGEGPRFQPVYVGDVAEAMFRALRRDDTAGKTYEFGGPEVMSLRAILAMVLAETGRRRLIVGLPYAAGTAAAIASALLPLPKPLRVTRDQVRSLRADNVLSGTLPGLGEFGVAPTPLATVAPAVLARYRREQDSLARSVL